MCYTNVLYIPKRVINGLYKCVTQTSVINYTLHNNKKYTFIYETP